MRHVRLLLAALALTGLTGATAALAAHTGPPPNPVPAENARPGTTAWQIHEAPPGEIAGYSSQVSVAPGETLELHVSVRGFLPYRIRVYRLGWYHGAGGRLIACAPSCSGLRRGSSYRVRKPNPRTGLLRAGWPVTDRIPIGDAWVSGYYLADLELTAGPAKGRGAWVPFVVRAPASRRSVMLVQAAVNTWQAYNEWGGRSLYYNHTGIGDDHVSFDRPYDLRGRPRFGGWKANLPHAWELPLVRFLERSGYDVAYTTDVDTDRDPGELLHHRLVVSAGHDEYWTKTIRDSFENALAHKVSLAFMGANTAYWQMRYEDNRRTIVEYRTGDRDPEPSTALKTVRFRDLIPPRPECELLGVQSLAIGNADYTAVVGTPPDAWFKGTGLTSSSRFPGLVGYEYDTAIDGCKTPPLTHLFHYSSSGNPNADAVRYTAPSGARVFSTGSIRFATRLDPTGRHRDRRLQRFVRNALDDLQRP